MRLRRREQADRPALEALLTEIGHGVLAAAEPDGWPLLRPLNFAQLDGSLYFHGSHKGEKMAVVADGARVSFLAVKDYALIPSFFFDPERACPATQFYRSVLIRGTLHRVGDPDEKARALQALMEKLQPEGGFEPITATSPLYAGSVKATAVLRLDVETMVGKVNLGQDRSESRREAVREGLGGRDAPGDAETVAAMGRCPISGGGS